MENTYTYKVFPQNSPPFQEFFIPLHLVGEKCTYWTPLLPQHLEIEKEKISNQYVKDVNLETNEIELNKIIYQNDAKIEVPVTFKKQVIFTE